MNWREVAKFFAGVAASQFLIHGAFAVSGVRFTLFGIDYSPTLNSVAAVVGAVVLILLVYYAWIRK